MRNPISDMPGRCPICGKIKANDEEIEKCMKSHDIGEKSLYQAIKDNDKKTINKIEKAIESGKIVRIM